MLNKEDRLKIEWRQSLSDDQRCALRLLYYPLIGDQAITLYETLLALATLPVAIKNHLLLHQVSGLSMEAIEDARITLEQYLLLKTYYDGTKNGYLYQLQAPLSGADYLRHDVFGRMYLRKMGKQVYEYMKKSFAQAGEDLSSYQEITAHIRELFADWSERQEQQFSSMRPIASKPTANFHFDRFLNDFSLMIFPLSERTKENLDFIAEKAAIYGVDEKEMQTLVGQSMNVKTNRLNRDKLVRLLQQSHKEFTKQIDDPYGLPPVRFLQEKQKGIAVSRADQRLIDEVLWGQFRFEPQLINVLIEYVLERCHQTLRRNYVEKIAATWVRLGIDTKEKALAYIADETNGQTKKPQSKQLPKWFKETDKQETKPEVSDAELRDKMRKLREQYE